MHRHIIRLDLGATAPVPKFPSSIDGEHSLSRSGGEKALSVLVQILFASASWTISFKRRAKERKSLSWAMHLFTPAPRLHSTCCRIFNGHRIPASVV
eukprot:767320-Hanusia_phi.AAC.23